MEELTTKVKVKSAMPSEQDDVLAAESSGASEVDEDLSEVARKDPIVSKYSKFEKKKSFRKPGPSSFLKSQVLIFMAVFLLHMVTLCMVTLLSPAHSPPW